ncbi:sensor histidine kinase [Geodermatophilus sp. TF02-6]|uniref:histidine kinase n=1 Tax=Geodermatophilus sp. TF02-6 TaxID=2250575 RepID=UPI000DE872DB|nr:histidine kinase [Geodermatophilus sp. TF02-6]RBY82888.1 sensor histidine kinase [Geodermatophilus sp. TF02-6]
MGIARLTARSSLGAALVLVGVAVLALGVVELALVLETPVGPPAALALFVVVAWVYAGAGLLAWWRRPRNRFGAVLLLGAFAWLAADLANVPNRVLIAVGTVLATAPLAVVIHLLLAFPSGRLLTPASRVVVAAAYVVALVLQAPLYLFTGAPAPFDLLVVADRPDLAATGARVQQAAGGVVLLATAGILVARLRRATPAQRRVLAPLAAYGTLAVPSLSVIANWIAPAYGLRPETVALVQLTVLAGIPVAFTLGVLRGGFTRTKEIEELAEWLGASGGARLSLSDALARTLGDDSLQLVFRAHDRYVAADGVPVELPEPGSGRRAVEIELAGRRVGAIVYDATLIADAELVRTAGRVVAIAVDRERLTAELRASQDALRLSRARIVEAGDRERRRIARDLHDGLQVRLVLLAMDAQQVAEGPGAPAGTREAAVALRVGIDAAAAELRRLVHAVMPAALIERGLAAATEDLVDRMPVPTRLDLGAIDDRLAPAVESTAYFVVAEGLTNALKHARARHLLVRLASTDGRLVVEVHDDGVGGASASGSGLHGVADRVDTLGGRLQVRSAVGGGTVLVAELPCAS